MNEKIRVALVTGQHPFDVPALYHVFHDMPDIAFYPQNLQDLVADEGKVLARYEVIIFYNFHQETPQAVKEWGNTSTKEAMELLGDGRQGIMVLHHALLAWKAWPLWSEIIGVTDRTFGYYHDQNLHLHVVDTEHPIVQGMSDWDMVDETYTMADAKPEDGNHILLMVEHPLSMKTLAWTRQYRKSPVFCWQSGHDGATFTNPNFRMVMGRAIHWLTGSV